MNTIETLALSLAITINNKNIFPLKMIYNYSDLPKDIIDTKLSLILKDLNKTKETFISRYSVILPVSIYLRLLEDVLQTAPKDISPDDLIELNIKHQAIISNIPVADIVYVTNIHDADDALTSRVSQMLIALNSHPKIMSAKEAKYLNVPNDTDAPYIFTDFLKVFIDRPLSFNLYSPRISEESTIPLHHKVPGLDLVISYTGDVKTLEGEPVQLDDCGDNLYIPRTTITVAELLGRAFLYPEIPAGFKSKAMGDLPLSVWDICIYKGDIESMGDTESIIEAYRQMYLTIHGTEALDILYDHIEDLFDISILKSTVKPLGLKIFMFTIENLYNDNEIPMLIELYKDTISNI